jgi:hypothetical protein
VLCCVVWCGGQRMLISTFFVSLLPCAVSYDCHTHIHAHLVAVDHPQHIVTRRRLTPRESWPWSLGACSGGSAETVDHALLASRAISIVVHGFACLQVNARRRGAKYHIDDAAVGAHKARQERDCLHAAEDSYKGVVRTRTTTDAWAAVRSAGFSVKRTVGCIGRRGGRPFEALTRVAFGRHSCPSSHPCPC